MQYEYVHQLVNIRSEFMTDKKIAIQFTVVTFIIAYATAGALIFLSQFGYRVYNFTNTFGQFASNIPFAIYILSPGIASYFVLKKNKRITSFRGWLKNVFYVKGNIYPYLFVMFGLVIYFGIHLAVSGHALTEFPLYVFLLSLPGNLIIGGLEESGWMYILQPMLDKKYGYLLSSVFTGIIWIFWHIPLFFIPGTNHGDGLIDFGMFAVQCLAFRFFFGAVYKVSGKNRIFMCVLFHTMFNAASAVFGTITMNWTGTITANTAIIFASIVTVLMYYKRHRQLL